jgi:hypothetical protein
MKLLFLQHLEQSLFPRLLVQNQMQKELQPALINENPTRHILRT